MNNTSKPLSSRQKIYRLIKKYNLPVPWKTTTNEMINKLSEFKAAQKINNVINKKQVKSLPSKINNLPLGQKLSTSVANLESVVKNIQAPAHKVLVIHLIDSLGQNFKTISIGKSKISDGFLISKSIAGSDSDFDLDQLLDVDHVEVEWVDMNSKHHRKNQFFRYFTDIDYNLDKYQVYSKDMGDNLQYYTYSSVDDKKKANSRVKSMDKAINAPCFIYALQQAGLKQSIIEQVAGEMTSSEISTAAIKRIADQLKLNLELTVYSIKKCGELNNNKYQFAGEGSLIRLASVADHVFVNELTNISQAACDYPEFIQHPTWPSINRRNGRASSKPSTSFMTSGALIARLYYIHLNRLTPITMEAAPSLQSNKYFKVTKLVNEMIADVRDFKPSEGKVPFSHLDPEIKEIVFEEYETVYFDLETFVLKKSALVTSEDVGKHKPYLAAFKIGNEDTQYCWGLNCIQEMFEILESRGHKNYLMYAHNLGFDFMFIARYLTGFNSSLIQTGTRLKAVSGIRNNTNYMFRDSMAHLNFSLAAIGKMFPLADGMTLEKESYPHHLVTYDIEALSKISISKVDSTVIENASRLDLVKGRYIDLKSYAIHYCKRDVDVLAHCFESYRNMMIQKFDIDVRDHLSTPGLAQDVLAKKNCLSDVKSLSGSLLEFTRRAIVGGRCMTAENKVWHVKEPIMDFDANSLYPSAQTKEAGFKGFAKGAPRIFRGVPPKHDFYIAEVLITAVGINRSFPLLSIIDEKTGVRNFTNDLIGKTLTLGKQAIEDFIEFQKGEVEFIQGLFWDDGFNDEICKVMPSLYQERQILKDQKNALQEGIKLVLNSSYGKMIQKPITSNRKIIKTDDPSKSLAKNIHSMISRTRIDEGLYCFEKHKSISNFSSPAHLGVQILDQSKHIMNRVMCLAEDLRCTMWYQDTDSIHIAKKDLKRLCDAFKVKYGYDLDGKGLCQFSSDFKDDLYATEAYFLGKKLYLDCLSNGTFHARMKGIPSRLITEPLKTYQKLFNGSIVKFNLVDACPLEINSKAMTVTARKNFTREVSIKSQKTKTLLSDDDDDF